MSHVDDQARIDALVAGFFAAFDNRDGRTPELATLLGFFTEKAVVARLCGGEVELQTPMEFAVPRIQLLTSGRLTNFHEREVSATTHVVGAIAVRTSRYCKSGHMDGAVYDGTGTKTFQLVAVASQWRILSLAWMDDDAPSADGQGTAAPFVT